MAIKREHYDEVYQAVRDIIDTSGGNRDDLRGAVVMSFDLLYRDSGADNRKFCQLISARGWNAVLDQSTRRTGLILPGFKELWVESNALNARLLLCARKVFDIDKEKLVMTEIMGSPTIAIKCHLCYRENGQITGRNVIEPAGACRLLNLF